MAVTTKEAFWKEHQDSLIRIRSQLSNPGKNTPAYRRTPQSQGRNVRATPNKTQQHPPYGKYRRTPSPYLPKVEDALNKGPNTPPLRGNKFEVVPPVKAKPAFVRPEPDYDSWGDESDDEDEDDDRRRGRYKPKPYPQPSPMMMGAPFNMYYPPPPKAGNRNKRRKDRQTPAARGYRDIYQDRRAYQSLTQPKDKKRRRKAQQSMPMFMPVPMMPMMMPFDGSKYKYIYGEDEESSEEEEMNVLRYMKRHPVFCEHLVSDLISEVLEEDVVPDLLMEAFHEQAIQDAYDDPAYLPTLYAGEDVLADGVRGLVVDIAREVIEDTMDEKRLSRDPLEEFLSNLLNDAVDIGVREVVRKCVLDLAQDYMEDETAGDIYRELLNEELKRVVPSVLDEVQFDMIADEIIKEEVIAPEVEEEATAVAKEMLKRYDNKVTKRELKEVSTKAKGLLADSLLMGYLLSVIARQGKIFTQDDHANRYLDDLILNIAMEQYFGVQKDKDKTVQNKPLKKLHEKAFTEVALDVSLQQLTASLDEDLADVDEYERGIMDDAVHSIPLSYS